MRPKIICHMIGSIDGRLLPSRWTPLPEGAKQDTILKVYEETAEQLGAQGWIVGRKTMAEMVDEAADRRRDLPTTPIPRTPHVGNRQDRTIALAIDPSGKLDYGKDHLGEDHLVAVLGEQVSDDYLAALREDGVSYLFAGAEGKDLGAAMAALGSTFAIDTILLEGGGTINGAFLKAALIDEISLLLYPGIDGLAGIPSIFEYHGSHEDDRPAAGCSLRLLSVETLDSSILWLRYALDRQTTA